MTDHDRDPQSHSQSDSPTPTPTPAAAAATPDPGVGDALATAIGFIVVLGPILYGVVWVNLPMATLYKWLLLAVVLAVIGGVAIWAAARRDPEVEKLRNALIVLVIIPGAALFSLYFAGPEQVILLKLFAIMYLAFLPPWLYLQFMANRGRALWEEFVLNLHRLAIDARAGLPEPPEGSPFHDLWVRERAERGLAADAGEPTLYQRKFEGVFGPVRRDPAGSFRGENMLPVALAAVLLSVGWVLVLQPDSIFNFSVLQLITTADFAPSVRPDVPLDMLRFGFIGAYFYILQMLVRRYFQNDLKTSAYVSAIQRIVVVLLLVWVVGLVLPPAVTEPHALAAAFVIGVFPDIGLQLIFALIKLPLKLALPSLRQKYPLSDLHGLNPWYEARLLEEGVEDMQNLATANLVDVMLNTNVPVDRLVDWVDQSILYLHLGSHDDEDATARRRRLQALGVRTATDVEDLLQSDDPEFLRRLDRHLNTDDDGPSVLAAIMLSFRREPNLYHVNQWKSYPWSAEDMVSSPDRGDGRGAGSHRAVAAGGA